MSAPTRFTSGLTQAASFQPLGNIGITDPFFYASFDDDFLPFNATLYTVTAAGGSVAASVAGGSGGRILFTTGAVASDFAAIQLPTAPFVYLAGKKLAYLCKINLGDITNSALIAGLIQTTATPYTVTDGIYFTKAAGSTNLIVNIVTGSVVIGTVTIFGALTVNVDIDLGFYLDRGGNLRIFYGHNLEGVKRQDTAVAGPNASILFSALTGAITTAALNPTLAVEASTAVAQLMYADFLFAAQER